MKKLGLAAALAAALLCGIAPSFGQSTPGQGTLVQGVAVNRSTVNKSQVIVTGNTFQTALPSILGTSTPRQSLTIENNNTNTDDCWVYIGSGSATLATSIRLVAPGGSYTRYWPFVPSDAIQITCTSTNDTLYVDYQ